MEASHSARQMVPLAPMADWAALAALAAPDAVVRALVMALVREAVEASHSARQMVPLAPRMARLTPDMDVGYHEGGAE